MHLFFTLIGMIVFSCALAQTSSLTNAENFLIYYVFADKTLEKPLKAEMINHLKKFGVVFSGDDNELTEQQKENKYKAGPVLNVIVSSICEDSDGLSNSYKKLPVIELSLKVKAGIQIIESGSRIPGVIWEDHRYINTINDKEKFVQKAIKSLNDLLDKFQVDYQEANPSKNGKQPQFYLYL